MSWRYYETLTTTPDFTNPPVQGLADERDNVDFANARAFVAWQDRTDRIFTFDFQTFSPEEWRILRDFFDRHAGRARSFYLPAWTRDFHLAADASAGATIIEVEGHLLSDGLASDRPDTIGRRLMMVNQLGQLSTHWVLEAGAAGDRDVLVLDGPIPNPLEAGRTLVSICYLARLVDDTIQSEHISPTHARTSLTFRQVSHRRYLDQQESAASAAIASLKGCVDIIATDEDPLYTDLTISTATGPFLFGVSQGDNFQAEWIAALDKIGNDVHISGPSYELPSTLYNAPGVANQIALTFDASSRAVLAWEIDGQVTIARYSGLDITRVTFPGYSPVAFNTYGIDSTVNAGTATVAVFYLKRQDPTIYCRIISESFGIERRWCNSPLAPLYLHATRRLEGRMEIVGMDANHRLARWRSETYVTPPELQIVNATVEEAISGLYMSITVDGPVDDEGTTAGLEGGITGEFAELRVAAAIPPFNLASAFLDPLISGAYTLARIEGEIPDDFATAALTPAIDGIYRLTAIPDDGEEIISAITIGPITGSYS